MKDLVSHVIIYVRDFYHLKELFLKDATAMEFVTSLCKAGLRTMRACDSGQREMSVVLINRCSFKIYELFIGTNVTVRHYTGVRIISECPLSWASTARR